MAYQFRFREEAFEFNSELDNAERVVKYRFR